jgi:hypothetical protein
VFNAEDNEGGYQENEIDLDLQKVSLKILK